MEDVTITIKNHEEILKILKQRINLLDGIKKGHIDEGKLGKCRYCNKDKCPYIKLNLCKWENNEFGCKILDFIEIEGDEDYKQKLLIAKSKWNYKGELFTVNEIISARKTLYNNSLEKINEEWGEEIEKTLAKIYSSHIAYLVKQKYSEEVKELPKPKLEDVRQHRLWMRIKDSKNPQGITLPYVTGASTSDNEWYLNHLPTYKLLELGIICAVHGVSKGYIFEYLPNLNVKFRAYEVCFEEFDKITKEVNRRLEVLKHNKIKNFERLLLCPSFFCKDCSIKDFCDKNSEPDIENNQITKE